MRRLNGHPDLKIGPLKASPKQFAVQPIVCPVQEGRSAEAIGAISRGAVVAVSGELG